MPDRLESVLRALRVGVVVQGPTTEVLLCNPAALELLGLDEDQYRGRTSYDPAWNIVREDGAVFTPDQRPMSQVLATGQPARNVVMGVYRPRRGDRVWLMVNVDPEFDDDGRIVRMIATLFDITERRQLEAALADARKLESIGRLAGGIAHDFNNLLTIITSATAMAMRRLGPDDRARADLAISLDAAERAGALTRQLLTFARRREVTAAAADVPAVLAAMAPLLERIVGAHVALALDVAPDTGTAQLAPVELEQVLFNLAANARDAMPSGGTVRIAAARVEIADGGPVPPGAYVRLEVADDGEGMDEATRARVFEPFFTTKDLGRGTGLGLATVQGVVHQHGGHVAVTSEPGRGTTFVLHLPTATARAPAPPPAAAGRGGETVLVAEDEDGVRDLVVAILAHFGYQVLSARDGDEALRLADAHPGPIHLLLTDYAMPRMNGVALATTLRARRPGLKVLVTSGFAPEGRVMRDTWQVLDKPFAPEELGRRVRALLDEP
ncbi:MAG: response regulator [Myxococcales bacterium]|nr:response regulator [Myxococcales bacterium]MBP6843883.1 response regulator [Kofleriaceae bacterium]